MDFYHTFKRLIGLKNPRLKLMMLAAARLCGMRYYGIFIDPVIACNLKCRMCYFRVSGFFRWAGGDVKSIVWPV